MKTQFKLFSLATFFMTSLLRPEDSHIGSRVRYVVQHDRKVKNGPPCVITKLDDKRFGKTPTFPLLHGASHSSKISTLFLWHSQHGRYMKNMLAVVCFNLQTHFDWNLPSTPTALSPSAGVSHL